MYIYRIDWKKFAAMVPKLRERYLTRKNQQIIGTLTQAGKTETERFWDAKEEMDREAKILRQCLDGHSRSRMWLYMANMLKAGMLEPHDMAQFSDELQMKLKRFQE